MGQRFRKFLRQYWTILWIVAASLVLVSSITYAAYTKTNKTKNVVARYGTISSRFSSNYLEEIMKEKPIYVADTDGKYGDTILISNYAQANPTYHYDVVLNYQLEMRLGYMDGNNFVYLDANTDRAVFDIGNRYITVTIHGNNDYTKTVKLGYNGEGNYVYQDIISKNGGNYLLSLPGTVSATDRIEVEFSAGQKEDLFIENPTYPKKLYVEIQAIPDPPGTYTGLSSLKGRICLSKSERMEPITWTGAFNEAGADTSVGEPPHTVSTQLDGYNYVIQGMGAGTARLEWKSGYLEVNELFLLDELGISPQNLPTESDGTKWVVFTVDSNTKNRYDIQLYRTGTKSETEYDTWEEINSYVTFTFPYEGP